MHRDLFFFWLGAGQMQKIAPTVSDVIEVAKRLGDPFAVDDRAAVTIDFIWRGHPIMVHADGADFDAVLPA